MTTEELKARQSAIKVGSRVKTLVTIGGGYKLGIVLGEASSYEWNVKLDNGGEITIPKSKVIPNACASTNQIVCNAVASTLPVVKNTASDAAFNANGYASEAISDLEHAIKTWGTISEYLEPGEDAEIRKSANKLTDMAMRILPQLREIAKDAKKFFNLVNTYY